MALDIELIYRLRYRYYVPAKCAPGGKISSCSDSYSSQVSTYLSTMCEPYAVISDTQYKSSAGSLRCSISGEIII